RLSVSSLHTVPVSPLPRPLLPLPSLPLLRRPPTSTPSPYTTLFRSFEHMLHRCIRERRQPFDQACPDRGSASSRTRQGLEAVCRSEEHTSELQSRFDLVCRLLLEKKKGGKPEGDVCCIGHGQSLAGV